MVQNTCKELAVVWLGMVNRKCAAGAYRAGGQGGWAVTIPDQVRDVTCRPGL